MNDPHFSHSNSDIDSDNIYGSTTDSSTKHHVYNEYLVTFDHTTVLSLKIITLVRMLSILFLGSIPNVDTIIEK